MTDRSRLQSYYTNAYGKKIIGIPGKKKLIKEIEIDSKTIIEMFIRRKIINNSVINLMHWKRSNFSKDVSVVNC